LLPWLPRLVPSDSCARLNIVANQVPHMIAGFDAPDALKVR